jgi:hypothetical protein
VFDSGGEGKVLEQSSLGSFGAANLGVGSFIDILL